MKKQTVEELEAELNRLRKEKLEAEFLADLALASVHEIKNPLHVILGYLELLLEDRYGEMTTEQRQVLQTLHLNAMRIGSVVSEVYGYSILQRPEVRNRLFDIYDVISSSLKNMVFLEDGKLRVVKPRVFQQGNPYRSDNHTEPLNVYGNPSLTQLVLTELFTNAVKYGEEEIDLDVGVKGDFVRCGVTNRGHVSEEDRERIFGRGYRGSMSSGRGGTGAGLYVSREIARKQRGDLWFESADGSVTFYFSVPKTEA